MINGHLTDEMIQEFIFDAASMDSTASAHISDCDHCKARVANYRLLFTELEELPKPAFSFDLANMVIGKIVEQSLVPGAVPHPIAEQTLSPVINTLPGQQLSGSGRKNAWTWISIFMMITALIGTPAYLFQDTLLDIVAGVSTMVTYLIIMTILLIAGFLVFDEYRKYNQQINNLDI